MENIKSTVSRIKRKGSSRDENETKKRKPRYNNLDEKQENVVEKTKIHPKTEHSQAFKGKTQTYQISLDGINQPTSVEAVFDETHDAIKEILENNILLYKSMQVTLTLVGHFEEYEYETFHFDAKMELRTKDYIEQYLVVAKEKIQSKFYDYYSNSEERKQFTFFYLNLHDIVAERCELSLPYEVINNMTVLKYSLDDVRMSFKWSVLAALHPGVKKIKELQHFSDHLIMKGIDYPVQLDDIPRIEKQNKFSINVYMLKYSFETKSEEIEGPVYHTRNRKPLHINLLLLHEHNNSIYYHIHNLRNIIDPKCTDSHFCDGCLNFLKTEESLKRHQTKDCLQIKTTLPSKVIEFCNDTHTEDTLFVVYADFEALLQVVESELENTQAQKYNRNISKHVPYCYGYYIKCKDDEYSVLKTYYGLDCINQFADNLIEDLVEQLKKYKNNHGGICPVKYVPVFLHNLKNYDCHFIVKELNCNGVLGSLTSYFAMFTKMKFGWEYIDIRFLDSLKFLEDSVATLAETLDEDDFIEIKKICKRDEDLPFLTRKGIFPYNYIKTYEDLKKTSLPGKDHFYDDLNNAEISDEEYNHALSAWKHFGCKTIADYSKIYVQTDILLLADAFEKLRRFCKTNYGLDPAHYYSISGFSWDAMLKQTKIKLELFSDIEMLSFVKNGMRGGYSSCSKRHAVANNKYLSKTHNKNDEESYIMNYDANNLYGYAMSQPLPYGGFEWVDVDIDYMVPENSEVGYILEVDLTYPKEIHDWHSDFPFCPQKKKVVDVNTDLLIADLTKKHHYIIHHSYLALCEKHGLIIDKIHRVLKFKQKPWLKSYIDFNNLKRVNAGTEYEKKLYKLLNNSVYGHTCLNIEKYETIRLLNHWGDLGKKKGALNLIGRSDYSRHIICSEEMIAIHLKKTNLIFQHPIYVGFCILDLAKTHIYKFHYNIMKKEFGDKLSLLYTDTDSLIYQIKVHDYYSAIKQHLNAWFDTSNYVSDNPYQIPQLNKMILGYFKDVMGGAVIKEFICLRPKMYVIDAENITITKASCVPRHITDKFKVADYRNCLYTNEPSLIQFRRIKAVDHELYTQEVRKTGLSPLDPKRYKLANRVDTLPWGHYSIMLVEDN